MNRRVRGNIGEDAACAHLLEQGFRIRERNKYFGKTGEIDIIAENDQRIIFVEVKTLRSSQFGHPIEQISAAKQRRICLMAELYIGEFEIEKDVRLDAITIDKNGTLEHFEDAFSCA
jgi:putative endonuclease